MRHPRMLAAALSPLALLVATRAACADGMLPDAFVAAGGLYLAIVIVLLCVKTALYRFGAELAWGRAFLAACGGSCVSLGSRYAIALFLVGFGRIDLLIATVWIAVSVIELVVVLLASRNVPNRVHLLMMAVVASGTNVAVLVGLHLVFRYGASIVMPVPM